MVELTGERGLSSPKEQPAASSQGRQIIANFELLPVYSQVWYIPTTKTQIHQQM
jgi:hypothetical protein